MLEQNQQGPEEQNQLLPHNEQPEEGAFKVIVLRIPSSFDEDSVKRILEDKLRVLTTATTDSNDDGGNKQHVIKTVTLMYKREEDHDGKGGGEGEAGGNTAKNRKEQDYNNNNTTATNSNIEHRGFAFVTFDDEDMYQKALALETVRGGRKATSTKKHMLYIKPYNPEEKDESSKLSCFLWAKYTCPYGNDCKFLHQGPGGCLIINKPQNNDNNKSKSNGKSKKKQQKCLEYKKKGKCTRTNCPFSHDFTATTAATTTSTTTSNTNTTSTTNTTSGSKKQDKEKEKKDPSKANQKKDSEKDCINWKTKGKCRKGDKCPYKHDEAVRDAALKKKRKRTQRHQEEQEQDDNNNNKKKQKRSKKQPLWVRIFGLNYETQEEDVREFLQECGPIVEIQFPRFEDSGRSKGYCGVLFQSPKAVEKALELDGAELHGRWLRIQAGKMLLEQWEGRERQEQEQQHAQPQQQEQHMLKQAAQQDSAEG